MIHSMFEKEASKLPKRKIVVIDKPDFWTKNPPVKNDNGEVVSGGMLDHQKRWWELPNFVKALVAGYGAGKTHIMAKRAIASALHNSPGPFMLVSPTYSMARETTIVSIEELLRGKQTMEPKLRFSYHKTEHRFDINYNGIAAKILIYSGEIPSLLKGPNIAAAGIDEPFIQDREVYTQVMARLRHPQAKKPELLLTGTPEELNWGYDLCVGQEKENNDVGLVTAATGDNIIIGPSYAARLVSSLTKEQAEVYVGGLFRQLGMGLVYYAFSRELNVVDLKLPTEDQFRSGQYIMGVGMDFNVNPMTMVVFVKWDKRIHIIDEYELPNSDTQDACRKLREDYKWLVTEVYPDPSGKARNTNSPAGKTDFHYLREAGLNIYAPNAGWPLRDSYNSVNAAFRAGDTMDVKVTISPRCPKLIKYLSLYSHQKKNKQEAMSHLLDAMRYPITYLFPINREWHQQTKLTGY